MEAKIDSSPARPPEPKLISTYDEKGHGRWYAGAPPQAGSDLPVIVFVPGLGDFAPSFWKDNGIGEGDDLYAQAWGSGFRTAFVSFMADGEKPFDMWKNGRILAGQLEDICRYYKTDTVVIAAHSKGGVDAQTTAVFYGAAARIKKLITLSSPHWGSQLADLAYSTFGWDLAERLGQHSEGCFCMQTAYMQAYRKAVDASPFNNVTIETFAGNGGAPVFSELWAAARFMSLYGENDGVVTVKSAQNPRGHHRATLPLNHIQMMTGKAIWPSLKSAILGAPEPLQQAAAKPAPAFGFIFRGGSLEAGVADEFPIDSTVKSMELFLALSCQSGEQAETEIQIFAPSGAQYKKIEVVNGPFGTRLLRLAINAPEQGNWHMVAAGCNGAYLAQIRLNGTFTAVPEDAAGSAGQRGAQRMSTVLRVIKTYADRYETHTEQKIDSGDFGQLLRLSSGAYTVESVVKGVLADGSQFERNILRPVLTGGIAALQVAEEIENMIQ